MNIVEQAITHLLSLELDDRTFLKLLRREAIRLRQQIDESIVSTALSELYPFFENSQITTLVNYLHSHYERNNHHPALNNLLSLYTEEGILVLSNTDGSIKVVHCNNKQCSRIKYPIQVSHWILDRGVCGDAVYESLEKAIKSEGLISLKIIEDNLEEIQDNLIKSECDFQERYKESFGEYRLS
ncbi:hypothetical protein H5185_12175 [Shewanella sp. SG44-6]|jgi:hypothetical protein|uniref:hypothetical protein n=1 Tax=Shewanella sp. SG44-6 TaxID=2760959 RepID=UPI0016015250|nr:hypothetical protein [Shewanella sp. SG44-6]MBB1390170.1 hypothetical protein [Shewanella sp. SG44-6]